MRARKHPPIALVRPMIVTLAAALLLTLELARRGLEPECPSCNGKSWAPHSTQLQCTGCGWGKSE